MNVNRLNEHNLPPHYPKELLENDHPKLESKEIAFQSLKTIMQICTYKLMLGEWINHDVEAYCGCNGINLAGSNIFIKKVENIIARHNLQDTDSDNDKLIREDAITKLSRKSV